MDIAVNLTPKWLKKWRLKKWRLKKTQFCSLFLEVLKSLSRLEWKLNQWGTVSPFISLPSGMSSLCDMNLKKKGSRAAESAPFPPFQGLFSSFPPWGRNTLQVSRRAAVWTAVWTQPCKEQTQTLCVVVCHWQEPCSVHQLKEKPFAPQPNTDIFNINFKDVSSSPPAHTNISNSLCKMIVCRICLRLWHPHIYTTENLRTRTSAAASAPG